MQQQDHLRNVSEIVTNLVCAPAQGPARGAYEKAYDAYKLAEPVATAACLLEVLSTNNGGAIATRQMAGVLLRRLLENESLGVWKRMTPPERAHFSQSALSGFLRGVASEGEMMPRPIQAAFIHLVAEIAKLKRGDDWPELFQAIYELSASENGGTIIAVGSDEASRRRARRIVLACEVFEKVAEYCSAEKYVAFIATFLLGGMKTTTHGNSSADEENAAVAGEVRMASFRAFASLLTSVDSSEQPPEQKRSMGESVRVMMEVLHSTLAHLSTQSSHGRGSHLEESFSKCLSCVVDLINSRASLLKPHLDLLLSVLLTVAGDGKRFESSTRRAALEGLVAVSEKFAKTVKKRHPALAKQMVFSCVTAIYEGMRFAAGEFPETEEEEREAARDAETREARFLEVWLRKLGEEVSPVASSAVTEEVDAVEGGNAGSSSSHKQRRGEDDRRATSHRGGDDQNEPDAKEVDAEDDDFDEFQDAALVGEGISALSRLASGLGGKFATRTLAKHLPELVRDEGDWRKRRTAFYALSCLTSSVGKSVYDEVVAVLALALPHAAGDPHPMVRYSAIHLLGNMAASFADPDDDCGGEASFSKIATEGALPVLARELTCTPHWRVRAHAVEALLNYFSPVARDFLPGDIPDTILETLAGGILTHLVEAPDEGLKENACRLVAQIALKFESQEERFAPFYTAVMPAMLAVVTKLVVEMRRGSGLEALSIVASSLPHLFRGNGGGVGAATMELVLHGLRQSQDEDLRRYALTSVARVAKALKSDFTRFLPELFPLMASRACEEVKLAFVNEDEVLGPGMDAGIEAERRRAAFLERVRSEGFDVLRSGAAGGDEDEKRHLVVKTSAIHDVAASIFSIYTVAEDLGQDFAPYVEEALAVVLPLVRFSHMDAVRNCAVVALPKLLACLVPGFPERAQAVLMQALPVLAERISTLADGAELTAAPSSGREGEEDVVEGEGLEEEDMETALHAGEAFESMLKMAYESGGARDNDPRFGRRSNADARPLFGIPPESLDSFASGLARLLNNRVEIILEGRMQADMLVEGEDEENAEGLRAEFARVDDLETELLQSLVNAVGYFLKIAGASARGPFLTHLLPLLRAWLESEDGEGDRCNSEDVKYEALCLLDDAAEFGVLDEPTEAFLHERCLGAVGTGSRRVTFAAIHGTTPGAAAAGGNRMRLAHAAAWGLGVLAHRGQRAWTREQTAQTAIALIDFIRRYRGLATECEVRAREIEQMLETKQRGGEEEEVEEEEEMAERESNWLERAAFQARLGSDNAVSALEKVARFRAGDDTPEARQLHEVVMGFLPLLVDADEAKVVNAQLTHLVTIGAMTPTRRLEILALQMPHGFESTTNAWDEDEAFIDEELRAELAAHSDGRDA